MSRGLLWTLMRAGAAQSLPEDVVVVLLSVGQSNANGRAEADRLDITTWPLRPVNTYYYVKSNYTNTDDGSLRSMWIGGPNYEEPDQAARRMFAEDAILASKFRALFGKDTPIYCINGAEGGSFIVTNPSLRDWQEANSECFSRAIDYMYLPAIADIEAAHPTKTIKVIVCFHSGESEAITAGTYLTNFPSALQSFYDSMNAVDSYLAEAPWLFTELYYNDDANEATINSHINNFVTSNSSRCSIVDISSYPRKVDLTTEQKAGVSPTGTDNNHTSYLGQIAKANLHYPQVLSKMGWPNNDISEITDNTDFDLSTYLVSEGFRLQLNRGNMTVTVGGGTPGDENKVTDVNDDLGSNDFSVAGTAPRLKNQMRKGTLYFPIGASVGATRLVSPVALSNDIFNNGGFVWTIGGYVKFYPNSGSGGNPDQALLSTTDVYSGTRSSVLVYKTSAGKLRIDVRCNSSTAKSALTNDVVFNTTVNEGDQQFIHWAITSDGSNMKIFINGVEVTLDGTSNGSLSGITPANFNNAVNGIVIGQRQTAASTFDFGFMGEMREVFGLAGVALSAAQIQNQMLN